MIRALIFDCFGVLYVDPLGELEGQVGADRRAAFQDIQRAYQYGYSDTADYVEQLSEVTGLSSAKLTSLMTGQHTRNDELLRAIQSLKRQYKIGLLSNIGRGMLNELFGDKEKALFDTMVLSSEESIAKPDPQIFRLVADRLGCATHECVMIDDSKTNCQAAVSVGMAAILYEHTKQCLEELTKLVNASTTPES